MSSVHLLGGGWEPAQAPAMYGPFLDAAGASPVVAVLVVDEGDGREQFARWEQVLQRTASCEPVPVLVPVDGPLDVAALGDAQALLVCGGLTPAYATALAPVAGPLRAWLADGGRPYAGFSAGAAVASGRALVGGWRDGEVPVCSEDACEDLDQVAVVDGIGLVEWTVDVHCAQWGTLGRLVTAVATHGGTGLGLDEGTAVHLTADSARVNGAGSAWLARRGGDGVQVSALRSGAQVPAG